MFDDKTVRDMKKAIVRQYNDDDVKHDHPPMPVLVPWCPKKIRKHSSAKRRSDVILYFIY